MPKTFTLNPASPPSLDEVVAWVTEHGEPVVIAGEAGAAAVVLPPDAYEELERLRADRAARVAGAAAEIRRIRAAVSARNADLTEDEVEELALEVSREVRANLNARWRAAHPAEAAATG